MGRQALLTHLAGQLGVLCFSSAPAGKSLVCNSALTWLHCIAWESRAARAQSSGQPRPYQPHISVMLVFLASHLMPSQP